MAEAGNTLDRVTQWLERAVHGPHPWWLWPSALVFLASICIGAAIFVYPDYDDPTRVMWLGQMFGGECGMKTALGIPCPQCGMTRSWVYLVRGQVLDAFTFNAAGALLLLNDRAHLVEAASADGVHVGQGDADSLTVRTLIGPQRILGRSTHNVVQIQQALPHADYVAFGPIFETLNLSSPKPSQGLNRLRTAVHAVAGRVPLVAIGGITASNIAEVRAGGANAWAVIGAIANAADPVEQTHFFVNVT